jgi:two-component system, LuxR family, sensor kinase FixL
MSTGINMLEKLSDVFSSTGFEPHGHCFLWTKPLLLLYLSSDSLIALSYYMIPVALIIFVRRRRDLAFNWVFIMFSAFIFACGTTHLMGVWTLWQPVYWLDGTLKAVTAGLSLATSVALWPLLPKALALHSPTQLQAINRELQNQIAERERAVEEATSKEKIFRDFVEAAPDAKVITDSEGQIVLVNGQTEKLFGYGRVDLLGKPVEMLIPQRFVAHHRQHRAGFSVNPRIRPMGVGMELYAIRKDGTEFPVEISLSPIETKDGTLIIAAIRDITERKEIERQLQERDRLATLGTTAAVFAHEIGNPLNGLSTSLEIVKSLLTTSPAVDPLVAETIEVASLELDRLSNLLKDYRSFARPQGLDLESTSLGELAEEVLASQVKHYADCGVTVKMEIEEQLPSLVIDPSKIKQVILNLCQNAVDAMPNGGVLTLKGYRSQDAVVVEVSDTGTGIAVGLDVFQLFKTTKRDGTGLGLSIVQQIISDHGGTVDYLSEIGKGTTFRIVLSTNG